VAGTVCLSSYKKSIMKKSSINTHPPRLFSSWTRFAGRRCDIVLAKVLLWDNYSHCALAIALQKDLRTYLQLSCGLIILLTTASHSKTCLVKSRNGLTGYRCLLGSFRGVCESQTVCPRTKTDWQFISKAVKHGAVLSSILLESFPEEVISQTHLVSP
jgi:hypothetical protein